MTGENASTKSSKILHDNINWLLKSDIRIKKGPNKGALYGWHDLNTSSFPFIYSEITGYAITCFCWIASKFGNPKALDAAKEAADWINRNLHSNLLFARPVAREDEPNALSDLFYSFDNGMALIGLISLYKMTKDEMLLRHAEEMAEALIEKFFDGEKLIARLDSSFRLIEGDREKGVAKWSTFPGSYHCKLSIGLLELERLIGNKKYGQISDSLCSFAIKMQKADGRFMTNPVSDVVYLHPHLYSCEGLIYSGITRSNTSHYNAGLNGIKWAMKNTSSTHGGLFRDTGKESVEQSDCTAQLLRLLILCRSDLEKLIDKLDLSYIIDRLHLRLLDYYVPFGKGQGGMKYQSDKQTMCSWCAMFSMQSLSLWEIKNSAPGWVEYFV